jgi:PAS domain S-box-containing protein
MSEHLALPLLERVPTRWDETGDALFRTLIENSSDFVLLKDIDRVIRYASPSVEQVTGYSPASVVGHFVDEFIHPNDVERSHEWHARCLAEPDHEHAIELSYRHASGEYRWVECVMRSHVDDPAVGALVCNARDVTGRRQAEDALAHQHSLLRGLIDALPDPIFLKDTQGRYQRCNAAFESFAGRPESEILGRDDREIFGPALAGVSAKAETAVLRDDALLRSEEWATYPTGRRVLFETRRAPLRGPGGGIVGIFGVCRDITQQRQLEDQLRQAGKLEAIGQLAGGVAHDFNNLLTAVLGNLALIQESLPADDENRELAAASEKAAWRAAELTKQLLGFARRAPIHLASLDLNAAVSETVSILHRTIDPRIAIDVIAAPGLPPALADAGQINQVLLNLCLNARDAMPNGGCLTIATSVVSVEESEIDGRIGARPGRFVRVTVRDTGAGIPPDVRDHIFEPFFTTKEPGKGTGLGLAMVHGIVQQHSGWIEFTSEVRPGTQFDVFLPLAEHQASSDEAATQTDSPRGRETILLADDEPLLRTLGRTILERHGYRVLLAADGQEAVETFMREPGAIDLAILDVTMPRLSGREAARQIVAIRRGVRMLLASGYAADTQSVLLEPGVRGFISKPYRPSELARAVRAALDLA